MGFLTRDSLPLNTGEKIRWQRPASYSLARALIGGTLYVTSSLLVFVPGKLATRHKDESRLRIPLGDIAVVGVLARTLTPYNGGMRRRVEFQMHDGQAYRFMIADPDQAVSELQVLLRPSASS